MNNNERKIWQVEITFNDTKPPHVYMMTNFTNTQTNAVEQLKRQVRWFKPETIATAKVVQYQLSPVNSVDLTESLNNLTVQPVEGD
jgi:hypothetical protein